MKAPLLVKFYASLFILLLAYESVRQEECGIEAIWTTVLTALAYEATLFSSIVIYRRHFHSLRGFPGPWMAGITKFWHVYQCLDSKNHLLLDALHPQYGQFVRTGPQEITIYHPEVLTAIDGPGTLCTKAVWYDFILPEIALNTTRSKIDHDKRRRIWDRGFTTKALSDYEGRIMNYAETLDSRIAELATKNDSINVCDWFYWFTFDVMGELAFGRSFGMLQDEEWPSAVVMLRRAMRLLGPLSPVPWLAQIGFNVFPWLWVVCDWLAMVEWCRKRMGERIQVRPVSLKRILLY